MSDLELMRAALENTVAAQRGLDRIVEIGLRRPVPAGEFTLALVHLRAATCAMTALELRARGNQPPKQGD